MYKEIERLIERYQAMVKHLETEICDLEATEDIRFLKTRKNCYALDIIPDLQKLLRLMQKTDTAGDTLVVRMTGGTQVKIREGNGR